MDIKLYCVYAVCTHPYTQTRTPYSIAKKIIYILRMARFYDLFKIYGSNLFYVCEGAVIFITEILMVLLHQKRK